MTVQCVAALNTTADKADPSATTPLNCCCNASLTVGSAYSVLFPDADISKSRLIWCLRSGEMVRLNDDNPLPRFWGANAPGLRGELMPVYRQGTTAWTLSSVSQVSEKVSLSTMDAFHRNRY